jgi:UDP-glucose 4-epimerase
VTTNRRLSHVIVTGGAGFVGSSIVELLLGSGTRVTLVDDLLNGDRHTLPAEMPEFHFIQADLWDRARHKCELHFE